jgi:hypothetical protein
MEFGGGGGPDSENEEVGIRTRLWNLEACPRGWSLTTDPAYCTKKGRRPTLVSRPGKLLNGIISKEVEDGQTRYNHGDTLVTVVANNF